MKASHVALRPEITRQDAHTIMRWMGDPEVIRYLNETHNISGAMACTLERVDLPVLTHLFNNGGRFFIVCSEEGHPAGFLRLVRRTEETEMVVVIGERRLWGCGLGSGAVVQGLRHAFFEWRTNRVVAKIHRHNQRSRHVFHRAGFICERQYGETCLYVHTMDRFLKQA